MIMTVQKYFINVVYQPGKYGSEQKVNVSYL